MGPPSPAHTVRGVAKLPPQWPFVLHVDIRYLELPVRGKGGHWVPGMVLHIQPAAVVGVRSIRGSGVPHGDMRATEAGDRKSPFQDMLTVASGQGVAERGGSGDHPGLT